MSEWSAVHLCREADCQGARPQMPVAINPMLLVAWRPWCASSAELLAHEINAELATWHLVHHQC